MRHELPDQHGLPDEAILSLVHTEDGHISITDVQFEALAAGVGRGESALIVSPTSTGKTQIALWAMSSTLLRGGRVVYLVTHRALARQKFEDFRNSTLMQFVENDRAKLVLATGDQVVGGDGLPPRDPLQADILVSTYEKYLALLAGSGVPSTLASLCVVCDEVQLVGDAHRGQSVEVLLTLMRNSGWGQLVALSAVLTARDASELADWLGVQLILQRVREKHLKYECWGPSDVTVVSTENPGSIREHLPRPISSNECVEVVRWLLTLEGGKPVIVFCMKKDDTTRIARLLIESGKYAEQEQLSFEFLDMPVTSANSLLRQSLTRRIAVHNADLTDEERAEVERNLLHGKVDVVCSTSSLAAGVNFPLGTAVFCTWTRWNFDARQHDPIEPSEFQNMAGRVGRMGFEHEEGRVIFFAHSAREVAIARRFLELDRVEALEPRINPSHFSILVLQLVASGICSSREALVSFISNTFSGLREADRNATAFAGWPDAIEGAFQQAVLSGLLLALPDSRIVATAVGKAAAHTGLQPASCQYLLSNALRFGATLASWLPTSDWPGENDKFLFLVSRICLGCPEFVQSSGSRQTRFLPWPVRDSYIQGVNQRIGAFNDPQLGVSQEVLNCAAIACDWVEGSTFAELEARARSLSAGMIRELLRNLSWVVQGFATLLAAATDPLVPALLKPSYFQLTEDEMLVLRRLPRTLQSLIRRLNEGLPEDVLWMLELNGQNEPFRLNREEILRLRRSGLRSPTTMMVGDVVTDASRVACFPTARPSPHAKANWLRDRTRAWKSAQRASASRKQLARASRCPQLQLLERFYSSLGTGFEVAFAEVLTYLGIDWEKLDNSATIGAPDYLLKLVPGRPLVFELKTRESERLVDYNRAVEVLAASEVHGYGKAFCITLCHPGVDPSVPGVIVSCGRLAVVESHDLGEALLRVCEGDLNFEQLHQWLATPGQATAADLPLRERA
jgi:helicase